MPPGRKTNSVCQLLMQPRWLSTEHNTGLCLIIIWDRHQRVQKEGERVGGLVARADRRCGALKGQGGVQKLVKMPPSGSNCDYSQLYPLPPCLHTPDSPLVWKPWGVWGPPGATRQIKEETEALDLAWCAVRSNTAVQQKTRRGKYRSGREREEGLGQRERGLTEDRQASLISKVVMIYINRFVMPFLWKPSAFYLSEPIFTALESEGKNEKVKRSLIHYLNA